MPASLKRARRPLAAASTSRAPFPSPRQAKCIGLKPGTYPAYVRWAVDFDYLEKLSPEERVWLSAFSEEHYRGWALKRETQVHDVNSLRESNAAHQRLRRSGDPLSFGERRDPRGIHGEGSRDAGHAGGATSVELEVLAGSRGQEAHELRGRNLVEDETIRWLDRPRRVK